MLRRFILCVASLLLHFAGAAFAQEPPKLATACDLAQNPKRYDGEAVRVKGSLSVYFEDFTLVTGDCHTSQGIWLTFGSDAAGIVASTTNDNFRKPGTELKVQGVSFAIKKDDNFRKLYALISARHGDKPDYRVTAELVGTFFAGQEWTGNGQTLFRGYGHLGCCSLLVITQVLGVDSAPPANLTIRGTVSGPDGKRLKSFLVLDDILGGSPPERQQIATDANGHFEFSISGQLLRFEDPSYRPLALAVETGRAEPLDVKLEDAKNSDWVLPPCELTSGKRLGFHLLLTLSKAMKVQRVDDPLGHDHFYFVHLRTGSSDELILTSTGPRTTPQEDGRNFVESKRSVRRWIRDGNGTILGVDEIGRASCRERV